MAPAFSLRTLHLSNKSSSTESSSHLYHHPQSRSLIDLSQITAQAASSSLNTMRSRASRMFGGASSTHDKAASKSQKAQISRTPSRTLVMPTPPSFDPVDETSFDEFDYGVQQLAETLSFPVEPLFHQFYIEGEEQASHPAPSNRWSAQPSIIDETDEDKYHDDEAAVDDEYDFSESDDEVDYQRAHDLRRISFFNPGKPSLVDIPLSRSNSNSSMKSNHSRTSTVSTSRSSSYGGAGSDSGHSRASTANSSISEFPNISPSTKSLKPAHTTANSRPFRRPGLNTAHSNTGSISTVYEFPIRQSSVNAKDGSWAHDVASRATSTTEPKRRSVQSMFTR